MTGWELPQAVEIAGRRYAVQADYRDVLDIIQQLQSPEETERTRLYIALKLFYQDFDAIPPGSWDEAARQLMWFLDCGEPPEPDGKTPPRLLDWEQDRSYIVSDINKVAGCEVRALPFLHWWTFVAWFRGIGEGQLSTLVSIRDKLRRGKKLEKWEREYYTENRAKVQLKERYTQEELAEQERLKKLLGE